MGIPETWIEAIDSVIDFMGLSGDKKQISGKRYFSVKCDCNHYVIKIHYKGCNSAHLKNKLDYSVLKRERKGQMIYVYYFDSFVSAVLFSHILKYGLSKSFPNNPIYVHGHKQKDGHCITDADRETLKKLAIKPYRSF